MPFGGGGNEAIKRKEKIAVIAVSSLILVVMVVAVAVGFTTTGNSGSSQKTSNKAVQSLCQSADYKETCVNSLSSAAGEKTDPLDLIKVGFDVGIKALHTAMQNSTTMKEFTKDEMTRQYIESCVGHLNSAITEFNSSIQLMDKFEFTKLEEYIHHLGIWLSGAYSFQTACLEQFESSNSSGEAAQKMKKLLNTTRELAANSLAIVTDLSSVLSAATDGLRHQDQKDSKDNKDNKENKQNSAHRRLLFKQSDDGIPSWVDRGRRLLLTNNVPGLVADVVVAQDGSGKFKTIGEALNTVPPFNPKPFVIHIKEGIYQESVEVAAHMTNVVFVGDGPTKTKITGNKNVADGVAMELTRTVHIIGQAFTAKDIGFENTAGGEKKQAVALRVESDRSIFFNCQIDGFQNTLYVQNNAQFYRDCTILGTVDFIFGYAAAVFQNCRIIVKKPPIGQKCIIAAHGRMKTHEITGLIFQNCTIMGDPLSFPVKSTSQTYLARPWKPHSRTIILQSQIEDIVDPEGYMPWTGNLHTDTCYFAEYGNRGPGANTNKRVNWKGIKKNITPHIATKYTVGSFIKGDGWVQPSGIPYYSGLIV